MSTHLSTVSTNDTTFDKIYAYYIDPESEKKQLSPAVERIRLRWISIYNLRMNFHSPRQAIDAFMDSQKQKGEEISQAQAYRDMKSAMTLFGDIQETSRKGELAILKEYAYKGLQLAVTQKNPFAIAAMLTKVEKYAEIDKTEDINFNPDKLLDKQDKFYLPKVLQELITNTILKTGVIDLNNVAAEYINFEEILDD